VSCSIPPILQHCHVCKPTNSPASGTRSAALQAADTSGTFELHSIGCDHVRSEGESYSLSEANKAASFAAKARTDAVNRRAVSHFPMHLVCWNCKYPCIVYARTVPVSHVNEWDWT